MAYDLIASDYDWSDSMNLFYGSVYNKCNSENKLKNFSKKYWNLNDRLFPKFLVPRIISIFTLNIYHFCDL